MSEAGVGLAEIILILCTSWTLRLIVEARAYFGNIHPLDTTNVFDLILTQLFNFLNMRLVVAKLNVDQLYVSVGRKFFTADISGSLGSRTIHRATGNLELRLIRGLMLVGF